MRLLWGIAVAAALAWLLLAFQDNEVAARLGETAGLLAVVLAIVGLVLATSRR